MFLCAKLGAQYRMDEIGCGTINIAEWSAGLWALKLAREAGFNEVELIGDSQLVVNQGNGTWKVRHPTMKIFKEEFDTLSKLFSRVNLCYRPRLQNDAAIHLENVLLHPPADIAAQFPSFDWPTYSDVRRTIDMYSKKAR